MLLDPVSSALTLIGLAVPEGIKEWQQHKVEIVRAVIEAEIKLGDLNAAQKDKFYSAIIRFDRAFLEGVSREKLRLMAQILNNTLNEPQSDKGLYLENILKDMAESEIYLISYYYNKTRDTSADMHEHYAVLAQESQTADTPLFRTQSDLVPAPYPTKDAFAAAMARLTRTGLVIPRSAYGGLYYQISPLMDELVQLCDIQAYNNPMSEI